jgi:hypothetical protein
MNDEFDPQSATLVDAAKQTEREQRENEARVALETRKGAYMRVFVEGVPSADDRRIVMEDLSVFCRLDQSAYAESERHTLLLLGRQEVGLRIRHHTRLTVDALMQLFTLPQGR